MDIHLIWAQDGNGGIGINGNLPWHVSEDLKNFKFITSNSIIVMGRKTWDSLPIKPLPNRENIVLSKTETSFCYSFEKCMDYLQKTNANKVFIIGGRSIYKLFFNKAKFLHITQISIICKGINEFFPVEMDIIKNNYKKIDTKLLSDTATYTLWKNENKN